jgi:hypothetical protein
MTQNFQFVHNTCIATASFLNVDNDQPPAVISGYNWVITCNIAYYGTRGVGETENFINAETTLNTMFTNLIFRSNVLAGGGSGTTFGVYQALNSFPTTSNFGGVGFVDFDNVYTYPPTEGVSEHNLTLSGASAYKNWCMHGRDPGADIAALETATGLDLTP